MNKTLRVAVVGAAGRGRSFFTPILIHPKTELTALCDINMDALKPTGAEVGIDQLFSDCEEMLDRAKPDVLIVGTPMQWHVPHSLLALERGIHVMSEVPVGVSIEECRQLVAAAKKSRGKYMMAENYCYMRPNVLVKALARAGLFGEPYFGEGEYIHELKGLNEITKWRRKWQTGINGITYPTHSLGPVMQWFQERVVAVCSFGSGHHYRDPRGDLYENEDSCHMACRMAKGGLVNIRVDMLSNRPHNMTYYSLQGTDGCYESARGLGDQPKIWLKKHNPDRVEWRPLADFENDFLPDNWLHPPEEALKAGHGGGDYYELMDFIDAIVAEREPPIDIHAALDMTLPGLVSQQSIQQGCVWLPVPDSRTW